jgi:hypothetical protein
MRTSTASWLEAGENEPHTGLPYELRSLLSESPPTQLYALALHLVAHQSMPYATPFQLEVELLSFVRPPSYCYFVTMMCQTNLMMCLAHHQVGPNILPMCDSMHSYYKLSMNACCRTHVECVCILHVHSTMQQGQWVLALASSSVRYIKFAT